MVNEHKKQEFLHRLQKLLEEYDATIGFACHWSSDTHGLSDDRIEVDMGKETVFSTWGWWMGSEDLKDR